MKVTAVIQSPDNPAVEMPYSLDTDGLGVIQGISQLLQMDKDEAPFTPRVRRIIIEVSETVEVG